MAAQGYYDVFISYGRKESLFMANRLYNGLKSAGLDVWFDKSNIPAAVDFQTEIDEGIKRSDNFIFVISPHAVQSPYCLKEVERAVAYRKRIIPILHIEAAFDRLHPTLQRINWTSFRQTPDANKSPEFWEDGMGFDDQLMGLLDTLRHHKDFVQNHTDLLVRATEWVKQQRSSSLLLINEKRNRAQDWILTDFGAGQPPCRPTDLHAEFICESIKHVHNLWTDCFIGYARENVEIRHRVSRSLARRTITTWMHNRDIKKGEEFDGAINTGIEQADNFLFFITKESVVSEHCARELSYAVSLSKRIIPLLIEQVEANQFPSDIHGLAFIDFTDNISDDEDDYTPEMSDYERDIDELLSELQKEKEYYTAHKTLLVHGLKWQRQKENPSILLRGYNLRTAETWLQKHRSRKYQPPLPLHKDYIETSLLQSDNANAEVFISYSRKDGDFARKLNLELQVFGKTTWFDQESIAKGEDFAAEIAKGVEQSDNFLFIISPDSVASEFCEKENQFCSQESQADHHDFVQGYRTCVHSRSAKTYRVDRFH